VVNTLNNAFSGNLVISSDVIDAQGFRTGNVTDFLNSVTVNVGTQGDDGTYAGLSVALYASDFTTFIGDLTGPSSGNVGLASFTPVTPITLSANTTYFVQFRDPNSFFEGADLGFTGSAASTGTGSVVYMVTSSNNGATHSVGRVVPSALAPPQGVRCDSGKTSTSPYGRSRISRKVPR
jgi:hypothetical protein